MLVTTLDLQLVITYQTHIKKLLPEHHLKGIKRKNLDVMQTSSIWMVILFFSFRLCLLMFWECFDLALLFVDFIHLNVSIYVRGSSSLQAVRSFVVELLNYIFLCHYSVIHIVYLRINMVLIKFSEMK